MGTEAREGKPAVFAGLYFGLVIVLSVPVWVLGSMLHFELLPGTPVDAVAVICPALAAAIASYRYRGRDAMLALLARAFDFRKAGWGLVIFALVNPVLFALAFAISRSLGSGIPDPDFTAMHALALVALFLPGAILEELGWSGFALGHLQSAFRPLVAAIILGLFWALWHYPALFAAGRGIGWIAWWSLWTVSARVIMVWLYNRLAASVFAAAVYHAASNLCWQLYPVDGSHFDPRLSGLVTLGLAAALTARSALKPDARRKTS